MEANKDASLHYLELAEKAIHDNDYERAIRYLNKSIDLFPTHKAKDLLERMKNSTSHSANNDKTHESTSSSNNDHSTTNGNSSHARHKTTSTSNNEYSAEEVEAVRKYVNI
ncbi:unnamed protein product [Rotaria socialis]|uniref:Uncharacterized protein n=1 Tax=Rotaria socialis TaxID=392032 RepID=A0A821CH18_9BILA|nr:unnamed protein product [Rotaria socialis]